MTDPVTVKTLFESAKEHLDALPVIARKELLLAMFHPHNFTVTHLPEAHTVKVYRRKSNAAYIQYGGAQVAIEFIGGRRPYEFLNSMLCEGIDKFNTPTGLARALNISPFTLRKWDIEGMSVVQTLAMQRLLRTPYTEED